VSKIKTGLAPQAGAAPRVGIYVRVSTMDQKTDLQRDELKEYAEKRGWGSVEVFEDIGISGSTSERPGLRRLLDAARKRRVDVVLIWKLDRLFRSLKHLVGCLEEWRELGVSLVSLKESLDLTTASGRLLMHVIGAMAEFERELIRERVVAGLAAARKQGRVGGRKKVRDDEAIRKLRTQGLSIRQIAKQLGVSKGSVQAALESGVGDLGVY